MKGYKMISDREMFDNVSEYTAKAFDFCERFAVKMYAKVIAERPDGIGNDWGGWNYRIVIKRDGRQFTLYFTDSISNKRLGLTPTCYDVLACIEKYFDGSFDDFMSEFGYAINSYEDYKRARRTYNAVRREVAGVKRLFGDWENACFDALCEIQ